MRPPQKKSPPTMTRRRWLEALGLVALVPMLPACGGGEDTPAAWRMPAETEPQDAVLMASLPYDYKEGWSTLRVQAHMIRELLQHVTVVYAVNSVAEEGQPLVDLLREMGVPQALMDQRLRLRVIDHAEFWVRDYGGIFLTNGQGGLRVVDFDFDGYGYNAFGSIYTQEVYDYDNDLSLRVAADFGAETLRSPLIGEGGNLQFNGRGTVICTEFAFLDRNPSWSRAAIEAELRRLFDVRRVIWLPQHLPTDAHVVLHTPYDFNGEWVYNVGVTHADEMVAWADERTVLLPQVTPEDLVAATAIGDPLPALAHEALEKAYQVLANSTDQDGRPLNIVRVPEPGSIVIEVTPEDGTWQMIADLDHHPVHRLRGAEAFEAGLPVKFALPASYMNYVVTNGLVLVPAFYKPGRDPELANKDAQFQAIIAQQYPGRRVVAIDADAVLAGGGGMHCITQQVPRSRA